MVNCGNKPDTDSPPPSAPDGTDAGPPPLPRVTEPTNYSLVLCGDAGVGKSCVRNAFDNANIEETFETYTPTTFHGTCATLSACVASLSHSLHTGVEFRSQRTRHHDLQSALSASSFLLCIGK